MNKSIRELWLVSIQYTVKYMDQQINEYDYMYKNKNIKKKLNKK